MSMSKGFSQVGLWLIQVQLIPQSYLKGLGKAQVFCLKFIIQTRKFNLNLGQRSLHRVLSTLN